MGINNKKLSIEEIKMMLFKIDKDIVITDGIYNGNKVPLNCECLVCENKFSKTWNCLSKGQGCPSCGKNGIKISKLQIREHVAKYGYEVVKFTKNDSNKGTMFIIKCSENHQYETSYREFNREELKRSGSCKQCNQLSIGSSRRKNPKLVLDKIKNLGYAVEENFKYTNSKEIHAFTCQNGHERKISYHSLERTPECPECNGTHNCYSEDTVKEILSSLGIKYISGYTSSKDKFYFECECGNITTGTLKSIRQGVRCNECNKHKTYSIDDIKNLFFEEGYILLEEKYFDNKKPLKYICNNNHESQINLNSFLRGIRCRKCYFERIVGENSPHWNHNLTDDERLKNRKYKEYSDWRNSVYIRDNYTCQCCGDDKGHNLNAHHLDSHDWAKDKRIDVENGITLCNICHNEFHILYGYGNNTREQFEEYFRDLQNNAAI